MPPIVLRSRFDGLLACLIVLSAAAPAAAQDLARLPAVDEAAPLWQPTSYPPPIAAPFAAPPPSYYAPPGGYDPRAESRSPSDALPAVQPASYPAEPIFGPPGLQTGPDYEAAFDLGATGPAGWGDAGLWADPTGWEGHAWRVLPDGVLWKAFLAGAKESRLSAHIINLESQGTMFDGTMGGRFALWRYGTDDPFFPEGIEFDIEGSAQVRLAIPDDVDVQAADFRAGGFFAWGSRWRQTKLGYYHLSSHLGDEFLLKNPGYPRLNYARDVIILAQSWYLTEDLRIYAEAGWGFWTDVSEPWEFQFGFDFAPARPTGPRGAPFLAMNGHLRQELNYSGNFTLQAGWAWRGDTSGNMFRAGLVYYNGLSSQYSTYAQYEEQIGFGIWFDR